MSLDDWNDGWVEGQRDMLAKCIEAVERASTLKDDSYHMRLSAVAALRALEEKP